MLCEIQRFLIALISNIYSFLRGGLRIVYRKLMVSLVPVLTGFLEHIFGNRERQDQEMKTDRESPQQESFGNLEERSYQLFASLQRQ